MKERFAIVSFKLPLRTDYPWQVRQEAIEPAVQHAIADGLRYLDCLPQGAKFDISVKVVERERPESPGGQ